MFRSLLPYVPECIKSPRKTFDARFPIFSINRWTHAGCPVPAPHVVKMRIIRSFVNRYNLLEFIETGTYMGDTLSYVAQLGIPCTSVELSQELHERAQNVFKNQGHVTLLQGDSGLVIPKLMNTLDRPALFWLDGHYSAGITARADKDTPVAEELEAVLNHPIKKHVILIDDARAFGSPDEPDYPKMHDLLANIDKRSDYKVQANCDIIQITPKL